MRPRLFHVGILLFFIGLGVFLVNAFLASIPLEYASDFVISRFELSVETSTENSASVLWGYRQLDLLALAFLMFASVICCSAIIGEEEAG
jgi:hypothetical protein